MPISPDLARLARCITPPIVYDALQRLRRSSTAPNWQHVPEGWEYLRTHPETKGWDVPAVAETYRRKWPLFLERMQGTDPLGVEHQSDLSCRHALIPHNGAMAFGWVLAQVARRRERISVLDVGGGCGHFFHFARALAPDVDFDYCVRDTPTLAALGTELCPQATFYADDVCFDRRYDLVWASDALHFVRDWPALLRRMAAAGAFVYLARVPTTLHAPSYVYLQRAQKFGYQTEYLAWCIRRAELFAEAQAAGLQLAREFVFGPAPHIVGAPEQFQYAGGFFRTEDAGANGT